MPAPFPSPTIACLGALIACAAWTPAPAQSSHPLRLMMPARAGSQTGAPAASTAYFAPLQAALAEAYPIIGVNADHTDLWPCVNYQNSGNPDCPTIGNPVIPLPGNAIVTGFPAYGWALQNTATRGNGIGCDALTNGTGSGGIPYKPCAQLITWFDDNSRDSTDDLLWHVRVVQDYNIVYDTGIIDFGPAGATVVYPVHVLLANDVNFGYWPGASVGPNNGNCSPDFAYPLKSAAFPGAPYELASGKTCARPHPGPAQAYTETVLATPTYRQVSGTTCTAHGVPSPCYLTTWTKKREIHQNFPILFQ